MRGSRVLVAVALVALIGVAAAPASAQLARGSISGMVMDSTGAVLPGTVVRLTGTVIAPTETVSGSRGEYRFTELDPGLYTVEATLQGFAPFRHEDIIVGVGTAVDIPIELQVAGITEQVRVVRETPTLDVKKQGNVDRFDEATLNEIPTARDPWVIMQQVPGVLVDRINVGGSESGQQSVFSARGDDGTNTMWSIDGLSITDQSALGASPTYYDFNAFEEMQFTTSALDPRQQTAGLGVNFVTKRGTNAYHGLGRVYFTNDDLQGENIPESFKAFNFRGNRIKQIAEYGGDVGGPVVQDKLWFWGAAAKNDIRQIAITGAPDNTELTNYSAKADWQTTTDNHFNFFYYRGEKVKIGRNASVTRPPETTWNQGGPTNIYKFEDSHVFGPTLFLSGKFAYVDGKFFLTPQGGLTAQAYNTAGDGSWHGSYLDLDFKRPQYQANVDGSYFGGSHEVKFGFQFRRTPIESLSRWPGNGVYTINDLTVYGITGIEGCERDNTRCGWAELTRQGNPKSVTRTVSGYVGDVITMGDWTWNLGLRFDRQDGFNEPTNVPANGLAPAILPALKYPGRDPEFAFNTLSPRIAGTYRIDDKTIVRGSYGYFASQLSDLWVIIDNPAILGDIEYYFFDANNNKLAEASELLYASGYSYGLDADNPTATDGPHKVDPDLTAPKSHSVVVALERELMTDFSMGVSGGWGYSNEAVWAPYIGLTSADYVQFRTAGTAGGVTSNTPVYRLAPGKSLPAGNGQFLTNREGYHGRYWALDFFGTKRLSNRWMFRGTLTLQNTQEFFDDPAKSILDPTPRVLSGQGFPLSQLGHTPNVDGGIVVNAAGGGSGSRGDIFIHSKWQYNLMGLYELPYGVSVAATLYGRQGYPNPEYIPVGRGALGTAPALLNTDLDALRYPNVHQLDFRAQKKFNIQRTSMTVDFDIFNLGNVDTILQQDRAATRATFRRAREIIAPRVVRFGLRFQF